MDDWRKNSNFRSIRITFFPNGKIVFYTNFVNSKGGLHNGILISYHSKVKRKKSENQKWHGIKSKLFSQRASEVDFKT